MTTVSNVLDWLELQIHSLLKGEFELHDQLDRHSAYVSFLMLGIFVGIVLAVALGTIVVMFVR